MNISKTGIICLAASLCGVANADNLDSITESVLADSSTRFSLSGEEHLSLNLGGFIQTGWSYGSGAGLDSEYGFSVDRARIILSGDLGKDASYLLSGQWSDVTSSFDLLDARVDFRAFDVADVRVGQFVPAFYSGFVTDPRSLITNNYSVSALTFGQGRGQGVELSDFFVAENVKFSGFYTNGFNDTDGVGTDNGYAIGARASIDLGGGLAVGGGYAYNSNDVTDYSSYTVDLDYTSGKFDFNAAWISNDESGSWSDYSGYAFEGIDAGFDTDNTGWRTSTDSGEYVIRSVIQVSF